MITRRQLFWSSLGASAFISLQSVARAATARPTVGAIRWDPWYAKKDIGARADLEYTLAPAKWHSRAPSCAQVTAQDHLDFSPCGTRSQIDREIIAAADAGINYWAFVWYGPNHEYQNAWRLYRSSNITSKINWCMIFASYKFFMHEMASSAANYERYFAEEKYQKVLGNRPLVYILPDDTSPSELAPSIDTLRRYSAETKSGNPYIVLLCGTSPKTLEAAKGDAIGLYSKARSAPKAAPYSDLAKMDRAYWAALAATGEQSVPTALTGADRRPRVERPVPWEASQKPNVGLDLYYEAGSPDEIAKHIGDMVVWLQKNPTACPAQTGLVYSWDEYDEGGSTLGSTLGEGYTVLDAVRRVLGRN